MRKGGFPRPKPNEPKHSLLDIGLRFTCQVVVSPVTTYVKATFKTWHYTLYIKFKLFSNHEI